MWERENTIVLSACDSIFNVQGHLDLLKTTGNVVFLAKSKQTSTIYQFFDSRWNFLFISCLARFSFDFLFNLVVVVVVSRL